MNMNINNIKIKFFSNFCDSSICKSHYERVCEVNKMSDYGINKRIYITTGDDYTHAIILNTAMPVLKKSIHKQNVIGLAFEPPPYLRLTREFIEYAERNIGKYFIGLTTNHLPNLFKEHYSYIWHITPLDYIPQKNKVMSIMVSEKSFAPGHKYRHTLIQNILEARFPIDIYGSGCKAYSMANAYRKDSRLKGPFKDLEPYENYNFHISIENFQTNAYFSEKITNVLLCGATPIYWGCKNILDYFPNNVIILTGEIEKDMIILRDILINPTKYKAQINVGLIKERLNLLKNVDKLFA